MSDRRTFIQNVLTTAGLIYATPKLGIASGSSLEIDKKITVQPNDIIVFQGDSITDAGRDKKDSLYNHPPALGNGYVFLASAKILNIFASNNLKVYNRGISGNKVPQLHERWKEDCLDLKPNILSILVGINDYWHKRNGNYEGNAITYKDQYRSLIEATLSTNENIKIIIAEPFAVNNVQHVTDDWLPELTKYQQAAKELSQEFNTLFIPLQKIFDHALKVADGGYWTTDGIHTTLAGAELMAEAWLKTLK